MAYTPEEKQLYGVTLESGDSHYRAFVGGPHDYSLFGACCFNLLTSLGLREHHYVLDVGCGSLRLGRLLIPYMLPGRYGAVEPNARLVEEAIEKEIGREIVEKKRAAILYNDTFDFPRLKEPYDFALAFSIFSHVSRSQFETCLRKLSGVLSEDGILVATYCPVPWLSGIEEYRGEGWVYPGISFFRDSTIRAMARELGYFLYPLQWHTFTAHQVWGVFARKRRPVPRRPQGFWTPPRRHITNRLSDLAIRALRKVGLAKPEPTTFPGTDWVNRKAGDNQ